MINGIFTNMKHVLLFLFFPLIGLSQKGNFGVQPGFEVSLGFKKVSEIGLGLNLYASKLESSKPFLVHSFSIVGLYNTNFHEGRFAVRIPYTLFLFQHSYTCMPSIGVFTEFNQDFKVDIGFRAGIVLGTGLHLHYTYTRYVNNSDGYFGNHGLSITFQLNMLHISQMAWKNEPRFRNN